MQLATRGKRLVAPWPKVIRRILAIGIILGMQLTALWLYINSDFYITRQFVDIFNLRLTGNCSEFTRACSGDGNGWADLCWKEKSGKYPPLRDFKVLRISHSLTDDVAYIQAELTRNKRGGGQNIYSATYKLDRKGVNWLLSPIAYWKPPSNR